MNYLKEINAFYDWLETNSLSTSGIVLWHALMHINNKAGWAEEFGVATSVLSIKTGLADRTIREARNELKQKGRIDWRSRGGNKTAIYKIIPLSACDADSYADNHAGKYADSYADNHAALIKLNKTKRNNNGSSSGATQTQNYVELLNQEFGRLASPIELEKLQAFIVDDGLDPLVVCEAIKRARLQGYTNVSYVLGILRNWRDAGVKDMSGVSRYELEYEKNRQMVSKRKIKDTNSFDNETEQQKRDKYKALYLS